MRVLVRVDFNVPIKDDEVRSEFRIERSFKTILFLIEHGAKIILMSHIESTDTLEPVSRFLQKHIPHTFIKDFNSAEGVGVLSHMGEGNVVLLENLRKNPGEKANNDIFARALSELADIYINDAFSVSHREHASIVGVPKFLPSFAGFLLEEEINRLSRMFNPEKPLLFILGGAKFDTKLPLITKFQSIADTILIGGALANDIYRAQGLNVGDSLVSGDIDLSKIINDEKIIVPTKVLVQRGEEKITISIDEIIDHDVIIDADPEWVKNFIKDFSRVSTVLWNGPLGKYESGGAEGTKELAKRIVETNSYSVVGGGDTLAVIEENNLEDKFGFISTGGGAMLDFLSRGSLVGIEALSKKA